MTAPFTWLDVVDGQRSDTDAVNALGNAVEALAAEPAWSGWTPVWTATGGGASIGDGSLIGTYRKVGRLVAMFLRLNWGSTTAGGTGRWRFTVPFDPSPANVYVGGFAYDSSAVLAYPVASKWGNSAPHIELVGAHNSAGAIGNCAATHPFTWATGDSLVLQGVYESIS